MPKVHTAHAPGAALTPGSLDLPALRATEVEIAVEVCSLCHSDLHLIDGEWSSARFPLVPGHEIVGRIVAVGPEVHDRALGERVGVGWQCGACGVCVACRSGRANICQGGKRRTCVDQSGGCAERVRAESRFAVPIPSELPSHLAAPLLCAGVTVYAPLRRLLRHPGARVGVIGIGGLGHLAVQFARALGAEVIAFDPDAEKADEARELGAARLEGVSAAALDALIARGDRCDVLLSTTHAQLDWDRWLTLLEVGGTLCLVGVPARPLEFEADHLIDGQKSVTGSAIGTPEDLAEMFQFVVSHDILPRVERLPMSRVNEAVARLRAGAVRYRVALDADFDA